MKTLTKLLIVLFSFWALPLHANKQFDKEIKQVAHLKNYLEIFAPAKSLSIWPGFIPAKTPAFLYFRSGRSYALHFSPASTSWEAVQSPAGYIYYTDQDKWNITDAPITPHLVIDKQNGFAYNFDQYREALSLHVFIHERFHRHQADHFRKNDIRAHYTGGHNPENLAYIDLENKILIDYLHTNKLQSLQDFLLVHKHRNKLLTKSSIAWEKHQQRIEGTASYVELLSKSYYEQQSRELLAGLLADELFRRRRSMGYAYIVDHAVRWRHYFVGASLALALDRLGVDNWKQLVEEKGLSPIDIVSRHVNLSGISRQRLNEIKKLYHFASIRKQVTRQVAHYNQTIGRWHQLLKTAPGVYCELQKPLAELRTISHTQRSYYLADQSALEVNTSGKMFNECRTWMFRFKKLPLLLSKRRDWVFKLAKDSIVMIDNKKLTLSEVLQKHSIKFKRIQITNQTIDLNLNAPGLVLVNDQHLRIRLRGSAKQGC